MWWLKSLRCFTAPLMDSLRRTRLLRPALSTHPAHADAPDGADEGITNARSLRGGGASALRKRTMRHPCHGAPAPTRTPAPSCQTPALRHASAHCKLQNVVQRVTPLTCPTASWCASPHPASETASAQHALPRAAAAARLHVAAREVDAHAVAEDAGHGVFDGNVRPAAAQRNHLRRARVSGPRRCAGMRLMHAPAPPRSAGWRWRRERAAPAQSPPRPPPRPRACRRRTAAHGRGRCPSRARAACACHASARRTRLCSTP